MSDDRASFNDWFRTDPDSPQEPEPDEPRTRRLPEPTQTARIRPRQPAPEPDWAPEAPGPQFGSPDAWPEFPRPPAQRGPSGYGQDRADQDRPTRREVRSGSEEPTATVPAPAPVEPRRPAQQAELPTQIVRREIGSGPAAGGGPESETRVQPPFNAPEPRRGEIELRGIEPRGQRADDATRVQPLPGRESPQEAPRPPRGEMELRPRRSEDETRVQPQHGREGGAGPRPEDDGGAQRAARPDDETRVRPSYGHAVRDSGVDQPWQPGYQDPEPQRPGYGDPDRARPDQRPPQAEPRPEARFAPSGPGERPAEPQGRAVYEESGFFADPPRAPRQDGPQPGFDDATRAFAPGGAEPFGRDPREGYGDRGFDRGPRVRDDYDRAGYNENGYGREGYDRDGYGRDGYDDPRDPRGAAYGAPQGPGPQGGGPRGRDDAGFPAPDEPKRRRKGAVLATAAVAVIAAGGIVGYMALSGGSTASGKAGAAPKPTHTAFQPTSTDPVIAAEQTGAAFLAAWASGNLQKAADLTDDPADALTALTAYKTDLSLSSLTLTPRPATAGTATASPSASTSASATGTTLSGLNEAASPSPDASAGTGAASAPPDSGTVPFNAVATVSLKGGAAPTAAASSSASSTATPTASASAAGASSAPWSYSSKLVAHAVQGGWAVQWSPTILAPGMTASEQLTVTALPAGVDRVTDADGNNLAESSQLALDNIAGLIAKHAPTGSGTAGLAVELADSSGKPIKSTQATVLKPVDVPSLKTTIDPEMEGLANSAVQQLPRSSMVILRPSTGAILAIANSAGIPDTALTGTLAPGSTMKMITSTAALNLGVVTPDTPRGCPLVFTVQGVKYHNATNSAGVEESLPDSTPFLDDFAASCNNAFTTLYPQLEGGKLASAASTYYGLNQPWDIGLGAPDQYFTMPTDSSGAELAQEDFGQGQIEACPLSMAAVGSTIVEDAFHQPYLVPGGTTVSARQLPSETDSDLKEMMHAVVADPDGTAYGVFSSTSGLYAKTGTAEAGPATKQTINGWIVVVDPARDIAVAGVVVDTPGDGASSAGVEAAWVLRHL
jgi:Penicillin binding protein transpeptidase domain